MIVSFFGGLLTAKLHIDSRDVYILLCNDLTGLICVVGDDWCFLPFLWWKREKGAFVSIMIK